MGCGAVTPTTNIWFDACRKGDIVEVKKHKEEYQKRQDDRSYCLLEPSTKKPEEPENGLQDDNVERVQDSEEGEEDEIDHCCKYQLSVPRFTGLMYAILYDHIDIVSELLSEEIMTEVDINTFIPINHRNFFQYAIVDDARTTVVFKENNIENYVFIPANSTVIDLCILLNNLPILTIIFEHVLGLPLEKQDYLMKHVNGHHQSNLMLLTMLQSDEAYAFLQKFGETLIRTQFMYENIMIENCVFTAVTVANTRFFEYFLAMGHIEKYKKFITDRFKRSKFKEMVAELERLLDDSQRHYECYMLYRNFTEGKCPEVHPWAYNRYLSKGAGDVMDNEQRADAERKTTLKPQVSSTLNLSQGMEPKQSNAKPQPKSDKNSVNKSENNSEKLKAGGVLNQSSAFITNFKGSQPVNQLQKPPSSSQSTQKQPNKQETTKQQNPLMKTAEYNPPQQLVKPQITAEHLNVQKTAEHLSTAEHPSVDHNSRGSHSEHTLKKNDKYNTTEHLIDQTDSQKNIEQQVQKKPQLSLALGGTDGDNGPTCLSGRVLRQLQRMTSTQNVNIMNIDIATSRAGQAKVPDFLAK